MTRYPVTATLAHSYSIKGKSDVSKLSDIDILTSEVAAEIIDAARNSGNDPIAWVTGNAMMPPARSFSAMKEIWQEDYNRDEPVFDWVWEEIERKVAAAGVYVGCPEFDNALFAVDLNRWQFRDDDNFDGGDTLQDEWSKIDD